MLVLTRHEGDKVVAICRCGCPIIIQTYDIAPAHIGSDGPRRSHVRLGLVGEGVQFYRYASPEARAVLARSHSSDGRWEKVVPGRSAEQLRAAGVQVIEVPLPVPQETRG